jgi:hypothetical protein
MNKLRLLIVDDEAPARERLMLYYDLEARLEIAERAGRYTVHIIIPNRKP